MTTAYEILTGGGYLTATVGHGSTINPMNKRWLRRLGQDVRDGRATAAIDRSTQSLPANAELVSAIELLTVDRLRTETVLDELRPGWTRLRPEGGNGMWIDTHSDAIGFAMNAQANNIRIADGPSFSTYHGFESHIRVPLWRGPEVLRRVLDLTAPSRPG